MILTTSLLKKAMPRAPEAWLEVLPGELFSLSTNGWQHVPAVAHGSEIHQ